MNYQECQEVKATAEKALKVGATIESTDGKMKSVITKIDGDMVTTDSGHAAIKETIIRMIVVGQATIK